MFSRPVMPCVWGVCAPLGSLGECTLVYALWKSPAQWCPVWDKEAALYGAYRSNLKNIGSQT